MGLGTETKHRKASPGGGPGRRLMAALMSVVLVASQAVGLLAPAAPAFAATGQQQIRCRSALHYGPFGVTGVFEAQGGGVPGHSNRRRTQEDDFGKVLVYLPPIEEQREIAKRLRDARAGVAEALAGVAEVEQGLDSTLQADDLWDASDEAGEE